MTYFCQALGPPLGAFGRKTTLVRDHEYFIPTKFRQNPSSGSEKEVENVKSIRTTTTDGRTTDGALWLAHLSLRLRWAKKQQTHRLKRVNNKHWKSDPSGNVQNGKFSNIVIDFLVFQRVLIEGICKPHMKGLLVSLMVQTFFTKVKVHCPQTHRKILFAYETLRPCWQQSPKSYFCTKVKVKVTRSLKYWDFKNASLSFVIKILPNKWLNSR